MKKILIIYPHFPPSNLAGVHRPRLFAMHLPKYGWEPTILTVHEKYYEEKLDPQLVTLLPPTLRIIKVDASKRLGPVGDIGLRAFLPLYNTAKKLIQSEGFDFLYIPIPSFYCALLGRWLHSSTSIKYGIDYIDPWVHTFPGSNRKFSRAWFATKLANILEPVAVKHASLITGVARGYYQPVLERNFKNRSILSGAMPYGGEPSDHAVAENLPVTNSTFKRDASKFNLVYAGAMLPKAYALLEQIFISIKNHPQIFKDVVFHFIGTGRTANDAQGYNLKPLALQYGLWQQQVFEYPARLPYVDVLKELSRADGIFVLGSTEPHYTPSKAFQAILSKRPVLAVLHEASTAVHTLRASNAAMVLTINQDDITTLQTGFANQFLSFREFAANFSKEQINDEAFTQYTAQSVTAQLAILLNRATAL